jgi:hypothetical protein
VAHFDADDVLCDSKGRRTDWLSQWFFFSKSELAERGGFEPPVQFNPYNGLANRRFRPLSHLSYTAVQSLT